MRSLGSVLYPYTPVPVCILRKSATGEALMHSTLGWPLSPQDNWLRTVAGCHFLQAHRVQLISGSLKARPNGPGI